MLRTWAATLIALPFAVSAATLAAAEQPDAPKCNAEGVCAGTNEAAQAAITGGKHIWASSRLYTDAPPLTVQKWLTDKPEMEGKFLVLEFWRTWCGACKRMTPLMNTLHRKYGGELAVIGITGEPEEKVRAYAGPKKEYFLALDRPPSAADADAAPDQQTAEKPDPLSAPDQVRPGQGQYEAALNVWGWPHVIILEPQYRTIIWEGFPGLKGFELTEAKVAKMLAIGRAMKAEEAAKKK